MVEAVRREIITAGIRLKVDDREEVTPGFKFNDWEMRGVPLRIEIGPKDVANNTVALARRDIPGRAGKSFIPQDGLSKGVKDMLALIQDSLLAKATDFRDSNIHAALEFDEFKEITKNGWAFVSLGDRKEYYDPHF